MPFPAGSLSFRRYAVIGKQPDSVDQDLLDRLFTHAIKERDLAVPDEDEYGWSGGRHVLDGSFSFEHNVFVDALHWALRIDTNKVPGDLKKAYQIMEEEAVAATNPSGFISKNQKREVKDVIRRKLDDELRSGRFRRSKLLPILWDLPGSTVYCAASGGGEEKLLEIFERTFDLKLFPLSAGAIALRLLEPKGRRRDYEDFRPTRFIEGPDGESQFPDYPWVAKGPEPKDFLGNEFLLWLWYEADARTSIVTTDRGGDVTVMFDRSLDLDCAYGQSGKDSLRGTGPSHMPEALDALRSGKVPRKAGLTLDALGHQFLLNVNAETFAVGGLKLPDVEEAETPRVLFEERVGMLRDFSRMLDALFETFLKVRASSGWEGQSNAIRRWITQTAKPQPAVAVA